MSKTELVLMWDWLYEFTFQYYNGCFVPDVMRESISSLIRTLRLSWEERVMAGDE